MDTAGNAEDDREASEEEDDSGEEESGSERQSEESERESTGGSASVMEVDVASETSAGTSIHTYFLFLNPFNGNNILICSPYKFARTTCLCCGKMMV